jgi:anti-sigma regulatory factor (Ser/Thr protein kinase)
VTLEEAGEMAARPPSAGRSHHVRLDPDPLAPSAAREAVARCCAEWRVEDLIHPARAVASELVANAVEHARTVIDLDVTLRGDQLRVAVRDGSRVVPRLRDPAPHDPAAPLDIRGYGLRLILSLAHAWGTEVTPDGKVVWATLAVPHRGRRAGR